jgi:hypothetical protein
MGPCSLSHQSVQIMRIQLGDLLREGLVTPGYRVDGEPGGRLHVFGIIAGAEAGGLGEELFGREPAQAVAQFLRSRHFGLTKCAFS